MAVDDILRPAHDLLHPIVDHTLAPSHDLPRAEDGDRIPLILLRRKEGGEVRLMTILEDAADLGVGLLRCSKGEGVLRRENGVRLENRLFLW